MTSKPDKERIKLVNEWLKINSDIREIADRIDELGGAMGTDLADQIACYAANSLQGTLALLRELAPMLKKPSKRKDGRG